MSLKWWDYIVYKVVSKTSETKSSLDKFGVDYLLRLHEAIALEDYITALHRKDSSVKQDQADRLKMVAKQLGQMG